MELKLDREKVALMRLAGNISDEINCEEDIMLPEGSPAVNRILWSAGRIRDHEIDRGGRKITLKIPLEIEAILRTADSGSPISVFWTPEAGDTITCTYEADIPDLREDDLIWADVNLQNLELSLNGSGKARVFAKVRIRLKVYRTDERELLTDVNIVNGSNLNVAKEPINSYNVMDRISHAFKIENDLFLPGHMPDIGNILMKEATLGDFSAVPADGKVSVKGTINLGVVYLGRDSDADEANIFYHAWSKEDGTALPFEILLNLPSVRNDSMLEICVDMDNISLMVTTKGLRVSMTLKVNGLHIGVKSTNAVTDVMSAGQIPVDVERGFIRYSERLGMAEDRMTVERPLSLPDRYPKPDKVINALARPVNIEALRDQDMVRITGNLAVALIYMAERDENASELVVHEWPAHDFEFAISLDIPGAETGEWEDFCLTIQGVELRENEEGSFDFHIGISATASVWTSRDLMVVSDAAMVLPDDGTTPRPTFLYYVVQPGDTLWRIARHYNTTVETIIQENKIANPDSILAGEKILIPPCPVPKQ